MHRVVPGINRFYPAMQQTSRYKNTQTHIGGTKMKFNKWTLALAAVGAVSLTTVAQAEEKLLLGSQANLTSTTISGFVDTSIEWNDNDYVPGNIPARSASKQNGFNLNVVDITLEKALDESEWASGYKAEFWFGPDIAQIGSNSTVPAGGDVHIKQAYVALRTPVGNGIDWKVGVFDTIVGYEASNAGANPNFTRSWGYAIEPTQHTGILGSYRLTDLVSFTAGVANTENPTINDRDLDGAGTANWDKTYLASVALTAPEDWGFLAGSTVYGGVVLGSDNDTDNYYVGTTLNTPVADLKVGFAYDYRKTQNDTDAQVLGAYASFQATEKLSLHGRAEYGDGEASNTSFWGTQGVLAFTATAQYELWENVISRLELRWDEAKDVGGSTVGNTVGAYANLIYNF
jgi:hypothetical protein